MSLEAIKYSDGKLKILDQLLLPAVVKYVQINGVEDGWHAIYSMQVRGAPAIAIVGCLSLVVEILHELPVEKQRLRREIEGKLNYLVSARPTAVNMKAAAEHLISLVNQLDRDETVTADDMKARFIAAIEEMPKKDLQDNQAIGSYGADAILACQNSQDPVRILTHCNTGSLATSAYGTALGVIRTLHAQNKLEHVFCTETRPYNQGARLTSYELVHEKIPATLVCDSAVAMLMKTRNISSVIVGADRIAGNGDTANKIGTLQIALVAQYHSVPFYVAAPLSTIDFSISSGKQIVIEERPGHEMTHINGILIAAPGIICWNPAFDVTPAHLITGIITEKGVFSPSELSLKLQNSAG